MRELRVLLQFARDDVRDVGVLAEHHGQVWFEYDPTFAAGGLEISPIRLPLSRSGLVEHRGTPGAPIPGVFNDARPEGWGLKLLHRAFQARGRASSSVSPLDELAFLGRATLGALAFEPCDGPPGDLADAVELAALASHARAVWDDRVHEVLPALVRAGGPSGGARPKALIGKPDDGSPGVCSGERDIPDGWSSWLVKFPTTQDDPDVGLREAAWLAMAAAAGVEVPEATVLPLDGAGDAFAVRRFDRPGGGRRLHVLSAAGALDADFRLPSADYEHLLRATSVLCQGDQGEVLRMFRLAAFNVASVNDDDHLKNVAWVCGPEGRWRVSPAFDLTYAPRPYGERWTSVAGVGRDVGGADLIELARRVGIKVRTAKQVIDEVTAATSRVRDHLERFGCDTPVSHAAALSVGAATARAADVRARR